MTKTDIAAFLTAIPLPVMILGPDQRIMAQNTAATALLGADMTGRHHVAALRQPAVLNAVDSARAENKPHTARFLTRMGARDAIYLMTVTPIGDQLVLAFEDQSAAQDVSQLRRDFVANVSHELRTPLTALLGFIETLQGPARDDVPAQQRFLAIMAQEADRMRRLVDDLLSLSRVEVDERVRPKTLIDLTALVPSVVNGLAPLATKAATPLLHSLPDQPLMIPGDAAQLQQVLTNLIENAIKYGAGPQGVMVSLTGPAQEPQLQALGVRLVVQDFGEGIASHHLARLTERFYRVDSHRSRAVGGTGLGLAIVKHIVNRHRGRILIESTLGAGTSFTILLPAMLPI